MRVSRKEIKKSDTFLGQQIKVDIKKNKVSRPFTIAEFDYYWQGGVDVVKDIMSTAIEMDIIHRSGAWYYLGESTKNPMTDALGNEFKWQGKDSLEISLKQSPEFYKYLNNLVLGLIPKDTQYVDEADEVVSEDETAADEEE